MSEYTVAPAEASAAPDEAARLLSRAYRVTEVTTTTYLVHVPAVSGLFSAVPEEEAEEWAERHYRELGTEEEQEITELLVERDAFGFEDEYEDES
jgi:hypothetical protein